MGLVGRENGIRKGLRAWSVKFFFFFWLKHWPHITGRYTRQDIMGREEGLNVGGSYDLDEV